LKMRVASRENPKFKELKRLASSHVERQRSRTTLLEGVRLCRAYLDRMGPPRHCVIGETAREDQEVLALLSRVPDARVIELDDRLFGSVSQLEEAVALLFVIDMPANNCPDHLSNDAVLLDRVQDPGNLGGLLRSAAAAGVTSAYLSPGCASAWAPRVLRAAMGAHFGITLYEQCDLLQLIEASDIPVYATTSHGGEVLFDMPLHLGPCAWAFGNEGQGIESEILKRCRAVQIPQPGGEESLNVAAAAAICLFESVRQRRLPSSS
jgi:RNA methyltransferase, TrmH family